MALNFEPKMSPSEPRPTMEVIVNGEKQQRIIDYIDHSRTRGNIPLIVPELADDEEAVFMIDGTCHIVPRAS